MRSADKVDIVLSSESGRLAGKRAINVATLSMHNNTRRAGNKQLGLVISLAPEGIWH